MITVSLDSNPISFGLTALMLFFVMISTFGQERELTEIITEKLENYTSRESPEKTYIHTDKEIYLPGETIWYKAYLLEGVNHGVSHKSNVLYVELLNESGSLVERQKLHIETVGTAGNFDIPTTLLAGDYTIKAYTNHMLNDSKPLAYSKGIAIWGLKWELKNTLGVLKPFENNNEIAIQFFPEGGNLVHGLQSTLGIKVVNQDGKGIAISGKIVDETNTTIKQFKTYEYGLGKFSYQPKLGKRYFAVLDQAGKEKKYPLPIPMAKGHVLHIRNSKETITVRVESNSENGNHNNVLVGHIRGRTFLNRRIKSKKNSFGIKIDKTSLPDGVAHFTLFKASGEPVCERLSFIDNPNNENVLAIRNVLSSYEKRGSVDVTLDLGYSDEDRPLGNFSMAVIHQKGTKTKNKRTIESWLLLNSDISGTIPDAGFFFEDSTPKKRYLLDALMLTHGWRRFIWKKILDDTEPRTLQSEPEKGIMIKGRTIAYDDKAQPQPSFVRFDVLGTEVHNEKKATDPQGKFSFGPYVFEGIIKAKFESQPMNLSKKPLENQLKIFIEEDSAENWVEKIAHEHQNIYGLEPPINYVSKDSRERMVDFKINPTVERLGEVSSNGKSEIKQKEISKKIKAMTRYQMPNHRIFVDDTFGYESFQKVDLLRNVASVRVAQNSLNIPAKGQPTYLIDGFQVKRSDSSLINPNEIAVIDVFKDTKATALASTWFDNSANGVIAIYTKTALGLPSNMPSYFPNITILKIRGFYKAREFYSPRYEKSKPDPKMDSRITLHWEPNVLIGEKGFANLKFYTGDVSGTYQIHVEGITADGTPIAETKTFEVE